MNCINTSEGRFWSKVQKTEGCWLWTATKDTSGYGLLNVNNRMIKAHRFSYELSTGKIPEGLELDHLCRNPVCVNPTHLEAVTHWVNSARGIGACARNLKKTHCPRGHELNEKNCVPSYLLLGRRICRICKYKSDRKNLLKRRAVKRLSI